MTIEVAVYQRLLATPAVTALVGTRVRQLRLAQSDTLPAIRLQLVDDPTRYHLRGEINLSTALVQTDVYADETSGADPYATAITVAAAVHAALSGVAFVAGTPVALEVTAAFRRAREVSYEAEAKREVRVRQDYELWYRAVH